MKVNLYYAPFPSQFFSGSLHPINTERPLNPKSALVTLATGLRMNAGPMGFRCDIEIIDMQLGGERTWYKSIPYGAQAMDCYRLGYPFEAMTEKFLEGDIHGITSNYTNGAQIVSDLARHIKQVNPRSLVVVGGIDATARPEYYLRNGADLVVKGEGEYVFSRVVQARWQGKPYDGIPNLCTRESPNPRLDGSHAVDMDALEPMSLDLVGDLSLYTDTAEGPPPHGVKPNFICWETSRGCMWRCSFCTAPSRGAYRFMTPQAVDKHFRYFKEMGINTIVWQEDNPLSRAQQAASGTYVYDKGRAEVIEIFQMAREYGFAWEFANGIEFGKFRPKGPGRDFDHGLMDALLWSERKDGDWKGCYRVQIPLDNLNLEVKSRFPKLLSFDEQVGVLAEMLTRNGVVHQTYDLFIGYPEQDASVLDVFYNGCMRIKEELSALSPEYNPYFNVFNLSLLPGAKDFHTLNPLLAFDIDENPEVIGIFLSAVNTDHFTYDEIYARRVEMTNRLNDAAMVATYDGIYTGQPLAGASPELQAVA